MGTNTGIGIGIGIPFKNNALGGDRPYLPPELKARLIGVWDNYGKKNTDADRNIIKNKIPNAGGDLEILNAAYKLNSGFGEYKEDFTSWKIYPNIKVTDNVITTNGNFNSTWFIYKHSSESKINEMNIKVSGIPKGGKILYFYISDETANLPIVYTIPKDGIYHLPESKINNNRANVGFTVESSYDWNNIRIEQIPSFEGAFVTDGINDLITSTKTVQEMGITDEVTVVSMIHQIDLNSTYTIATTNYIENSNSRGHVRSDVYNYGKTGIYGYSASLINNTKSDIKNILGDEADYYVKSTNSLQTIFDAKFSVVGRISELTEASQVAWYWTIIANKVLTTDQINQVIAYFNLDRTLNPDILCNTIKQGITNENHAEFGDKLIDFSGNGRDIQLKNIAWNKESGIDDDGALRLDGVNDFGKVTGMPVYKDYTFIIDRQIISIGDTAGVVASKSENSSDATKHGAFIFEYLGAPDNVSTWSFYKDNGKVANTDFTRGISYQSKYSYNGKDLTVGTSKDSDKLWLGVVRDNDSRFFNGAIYSLMSFPYSMSKFLIERQLKKYKLGTLYPDMVEFRPIVKSNNKWDIIEIWQGDKSLYRPTINDDKTGIYLKKDSTISIYVKSYVGQKVSEIVYNGVSYTDLKLNSNGFYYITVPVTKSPQKIGITIEQDENYVLFNPVITSNVEYHKLDFYLNNYQKRINIGDYIPKDAYIRANFYLKNNVDELTAFIFNGVNIGYRRNSVDDTAFNIDYIYNYDSPQEVNITIDEYIRYEEIVQPYPVIFQITDRNTNQRYSWGDKIKVGSSIRLSQGEKPNLLSGLYSIQSYEYEGETYSYNQLTNLNIILTKQSISLSCNKTWLLDDNEPKCILSPRLLRIPNSSYKILGHIPDISGHGNHGVIHNSAYAEGSGVNEDGSYQFDGVDDFVTIPTIVGGKQVLMKVNWQNKIGLLYDQRKNGSSIDAFAILNVNSNNSIAYNSRNTDGETYIDGILNKNIVCPQLYKITHSITIINQLANKEEVISPTIGSDTTHKAYFSQMALYDFMLFDNISTDDKIKELNEYVGVEAKVELPPYYWDAYGKTNSDADRDAIQQRGIAVGDYDLTNYNHAYKGMSGYNGYPVVFGANKTWESLSGVYGYTSDVTNTTIHVTHAEHAGNDLLFSYVKKDGALANIKEIPAFRVTIGGLEGNSKFGYRYLATEDATEETLVYLGNGTHELAKSFAPTEALLDLTRNVWVGIFITPMVEGEVVFDCDITIEVLPEYENGLAYDGITDYSKNANIPVLTDYTYIYKRTIINIPTNAATLLKGADKTNGSAFIADYGNKWQFNFGQYNIIQGIADGINWQTVNSFNGTSINKGENTDDSGITVAKFSNGYTSMVFYKLILYPKTISLLEINFLKNLMEKDEIIDLNNPIFIKNE